MTCPTCNSEHDDMAERIAAFVNLVLIARKASPFVDHSFWGEMLNRALEPFKEVKLEEAA